MVEGTCDWILSRPWFYDWSSENISQPKVLWVNGPAGFGKSVLCARVIQHLSSLPRETPVAYFFLSSKSESRNDPYTAVRAWEAQLITHPKAFMLIQEGWAAQNAQRATRGSIMEILQAITKEIPGCTLILDGLDECNHLADDHRAKHRDTPAGFLEALLELTQDTATRLLVVSRDEPEIRACFIPVEGTYHGSFFEHKITPNDVSSDIALYAEDIVDNALASRKSRAVKKAISQKLADRCEGQFLWIWLHRVPLESDNWRSQQYLEREIDSTPRGLEVIYERYWMKIEKLPERARNRAISLLRWAVFALRPLKIDEITEALAICDDCNEIDLDDIPDRIDKEYIDHGILSYCGSLLEVRSPQSGCDAAVMTLQLAHFSVKQYLLHNLPTTNRALQLNSGLKSFEEKVENVYLAQNCLRYLNCSLIWRREFDLENNQTLGSLINYATDSWQRHASLGHSDDEVVVDLVNQLFDTRGPVWASWIEWVVSNDDRNEIKPPSPVGRLPSPLYHAAFLRLPKTVDFLIQDHQHNPDEKGAKGQTALGVACENNHHETAKTLIDHGADLNMADENGSVPVHFACRNGHMELTRLLLQKNADISLKNSHGWTPLHIASNRGYREICELLLQRDSEIDPANIHDWTPLHEAAYCGHDTVCEFLLENGAKAWLVDHKGRTPLHLASEEGHFNVVSLLLQTNPDLSIKSSHGWTPLNAASKEGFFEICRLLLQSGSKVNSTNVDDWTPLHEASYHGHDRICSLLLENNAEVDPADNEGRTPLHLASEEGHIEVVRLFLESNASVDVVTSLDKKAPIHFASINGKAEIVELLINGGADISLAQHDGWTPLHLASRNGHPEILQLLIESGADVCVAEDEGWTPLHLASSEGYFGMVGLLVKSGADVCVAADDGWTPLHLASSEGYRDIAELLIASGASACASKDDGTPLRLASQNGYYEVARLLLKNSAQVNAIASHNGSTPIQDACLHGHLKMVEILINSGANIHLADHEGWTPIHLASSEGYLEIVDLLIKSGAEASATMPSGSTPVHLAAYNGHVKVLELLIEAGADTTVLDLYGYSPLHEAAEEGKLEVAKLLLGPSKCRMETQDCTGRTALFVAAARGHLQFVRWLLAQNASIKLRDRWGSSPLSAAVRNGHAEVVELLLPFADATESSGGLKQSLAWWASKSGCPRVVEQVRQWAQNMGLSTCESDLEVSCNKGDFDTDGWCNICTRDLPFDAAAYQCNVCDDFDICLDCHSRGAQCLSASHDWSHMPAPGSSD